MSILLFLTIFYMNDSNIECEEIIEFDFEEYRSLIYSITNDNWKIWYIDLENGDEFEEYFTKEEIEVCDSLTIRDIILNKEQIKEYITIAYTRE